MLRSNHGVHFNWNALVAAAETMNKLSLQMKTALFTDLWYFLPLVEGSVCMLVLSNIQSYCLLTHQVVYMYRPSGNVPFV